MIPPIKAWEELVGSPRINVNRFHAIAPIRAAITVVCAMADASTMPPPIILATAVDMNAPAMLSTAAIRTAHPGLRTWVETTVAMALALSCQPFEKSNARARITTNTSRVVGSNMIGWETSHDAGRMAFTD